MEAKNLSSLAICPIKFDSFDKLLGKVQCIDASVLYCLLHFQCKHTKITKYGHRCIARSREQLSQWLQLSTRKIDTLLNKLETLGFIKKRSSLWYGKKRLFISCHYLDELSINSKLLNILIKKTGSIKNAVVLAKLAFAYNNTNIQNENKSWCTFKKDTLSTWCGMSIRTLDKILKELSEKGLILKKILNRYGKRQQHFHIYQKVIHNINEEYSALNTETTTKNMTNNNTNNNNCVPQPAKNAKPIRIKTHQQKENNINIFIFDEKNEPEKFLKSAMSQLKHSLNVSQSQFNELYEQVKFTIKHLLQNKKVQSFRHAVYRCLKIIRDGNWKVPFGFYKYADYGKKLAEIRRLKAHDWEIQKSVELAQRQNKPKINKDLDNQLERISGRLKEFYQQTSVSSTQKQILESLVSQAQKLISLGANRNIFTQILS